MNFSQKLGLGGHSFIGELGNDPAASFEEQCAIVGACLDRGVSLIDTTYYQERVALGRVLRELGRRSEARIMAWNFFRKPGDDNVLQPYTAYAPHHIDQMLEELQTDAIDLLVIHADDDTARQQRELELAARWIGEGKVRRAALGMLKTEHLERLPEEHPISYALAPYNAFNQSTETVFRRANELGLRCIALSPFIRGWKLDEIGGDPAHAADILLRWTAQQTLVESVIVSMRRSSYVDRNLATLARGPLSEAEQRELQGWIERLT